MAKALIRYETLDASDVDRIMHGDNLTKPTVGDLLDKEQNKRGTVDQPAPDTSQPDVRIPTACRRRRAKRGSRRFAACKAG